MSIKIEIDAHPDRGDMREQIEQAMSALGFKRESPTLRQVAEAAYDAGFSVDFEMEPRVQTPASGHDNSANYMPDDEAQTVHEAAADDKPTETQPQRERGKPAPGRKRRTREEIAEDEAADEADVAYEKASPEAKVLIDEARRHQYISSGENRVGPEDEPEDAEVDAADEAAEAAASKADGPTLDDVRLATGRYAKAFGNAAMFTDIPLIVGGAVADVKPEDIEAVVKKIDDAIAADPYKRNDATSDHAPAEDDAPHATKDDVIEAMKKYLVMADGPGANPADLSTMPNATEDFGKLFTMIFGAGITKLGHIPAKPENYGKVLAGINEMIAKDPFGRKS